jgi:hypothetical protein
MVVLRGELLSKRQALACVPVWRYGGNVPCKTCIELWRMLEQCAGELHKQTGTLAGVAGMENPAYSERLNSLREIQQKCFDILEQLSRHDRKAHSEPEDTP